MNNIQTPGRGSFGSKFGIIAAAAGSAIGLGNIWRFPYVLGENGGGAFLLIYIGFILAIGIPVMVSEFAIGRSARSNPYGAFRKLAPGKPWFIIGILGIFAAFMILAFYGAVGGWTLEYLYKSVLGDFRGKTPDEINALFSQFRGDSFRTVLWQVVFMGLTFLIVMAGIEKGIEKYNKILMPLLLLILITIAIRSVTLPGAKNGLVFLFKPDFTKLNAGVIFAALGQAFFSLSIGMGALITYGSYINKNDNLGNSAFIVSLSDTFIAVLAGIAIFPAVFAFGLKPQAGTGLVFQALPNIFQQMHGGYYISILFFILLTVAALTSAISLLEVVVATFVEELNLSRHKASMIAAVLITLLGIPCALSWGVMSGITIGEHNFFDILELVSTKFILPIGGFFIVLFIAWFHGRTNVFNEISSSGSQKALLFNTYFFLVRYIVPIAITMVFLNEMGILKVAD